MTPLEAKLGYVFKDRGLLAQALTHSSHSAANYERLEFLGDRVLGVVVGEWLFEQFGEAGEGELSRRYMALVREGALAAVAAQWGVAGAMALGPGEAVKPSLVADVVEALLGAVWREGGMDEVVKIVRRDWAGLVEHSDQKDPKTKLQELVQGKGGSLPQYDVLAEDGPAHDRIFTVKVTTVLGDAEGTGKSKQLAGLDAARALLKTLGE